MDSTINKLNGRPFSPRYHELLQQRMSLPVYHHKDEFSDALKSNQTLILVGESGTGKTTQIPQFALDAVQTNDRDKFTVACTQPRKVPTMFSSTRVAEEMDVSLGEEVGYAFLHEDCTSARTVLKYLTDDTLLREAMRDPLLEGYKVIVVDEAHWRTMATDVLLGVLKGVLRDRPDLKLVVMSATHEEGEKLRGYFTGVVPLITIRDENLYPDEYFIENSPEILSSDLTSIVLTMKRLGVEDVFRFDFVDPPPEEAVTTALEALNYLGAVDDDGNLTAVGAIMSEFPLDPQMAKTLVVSPEYNSSNEILSICAMLLARKNCFFQPREEAEREIAEAAKARFVHVGGDHLTLLNVYNAYKQNKGDVLWCYDYFIHGRVMKRAENVRQNLVKIMVRFDLRLCSTDSNSGDYDVNIRKALLAGYFMQVAHLESGGDYVTVKDNVQTVQLNPSNCLDHKPEWVVYDEYVCTTTSIDFICMVTDVRGEWLVDVAPRYYDLSKFPDCEVKRELENVYKIKRENMTSEE